MMIAWILPVTIAAVLWAAHMAFVKLAIDHIAPAALVFFIYLVSIVTTLMVLVITKTRVDFSIFLQNRLLILYVVLAGVTIGLVDFFFSKGLAVASPPPIAIYSPLFMTIALVVTALIGVLLLHEALTPLRMAGFALSIAGIFLLVR